MNHQLFFTTGPSQLYPTYEFHLKNAIKENITSINHRTAQAIGVIKFTTEQLRELLAIPADYDVFFLNSANEAWDRISQNLVIKSSHHFSNGAFGKKFYDFSKLYHFESTLTEVGFGENFTDWTVPEQAELIGVTKNETSNGYTITEDEIQNLRDTYPNKIIALDMVSAAGGIPITLENVDVAYFSVQKCMGIPAGLSVVIANKKCQEKASKKQTLSPIGSYRSFLNLKKFSDKFQTPETPNLLAIYILGKIAEDMLRYGASRIYNDIIYKSVTLKNTIAAHPDLNLLVQSKAHQSHTSIVAETKTDSTNYLTYLKEQKIIISDGYRENKSNHIRIANFPAHSKESIEMLCDLLLKFQ